MTLHCEYEYCLPPSYYICTLAPNTSWSRIWKGFDWRAEMLRTTTPGLPSSTKSRKVWRKNSQISRKVHNFLVTKFKKESDFIYWGWQLVPSLTARCVWVCVCLHTTQLTASWNIRRILRIIDKTPTGLLMTSVEAKAIDGHTHAKNGLKRFKTQVST